MPDDPASARWSATAIALHWATVLALIIGAGAVLLRGEIDTKDLRALLLEVHRWSGVLVLLLTCVRLVWRAIGPVRPQVANSRPARHAAAVVHAALYVGLLAVPLLGWWLSETRGLPWRVLGHEWPHWLSPDPDQADDAGTLHAIAAWVLLGAAAAHIAAALWHHFFRRDGLLQVMSWRAPRNQAQARPRQVDVHPAPSNRGSA